MTSLAFDIHDGPCEAHSKSLHRLALFEVSTYTPGAGQHLWNEAYCCPTCGMIWARETYLTIDSISIKWAFTPRECNSQVLSAEHFDYFLISTDLSPHQMEFLIHEYARCHSYYRQHTSHLTRGHDV